MDEYEVPIKVHVSSDGEVKAGSSALRFRYTKLLWVADSEDPPRKKRPSKKEAPENKMMMNSEENKEKGPDRENDQSPKSSEE